MIMETAIHKVAPVVAEMRKYAEDSRTLSVMGKGDRAILAAATGTPLADYDTTALVQTLLQMFNFIALDVGYRKPEEVEWQYLVTRIAEILRRYHADLTTTDIKTAFELLLVGELDPYLPKNGNGEPDRAHYQSFNADYVIKVVTAYKKRQGATINKARELTKIEPTKTLTAGEPQGWDKKGVAHRVYETYLKTSRLTFGPHEDVVVYEYLKELQLVEAVSITDADKETAFRRYCMQADLGYRSQYEARWVKQAGKDAREIQPIAHTVALHRAIKGYFDKIIAQNTLKKVN